MTVVLRSAPSSWHLERPSVVAIGVFDGVHRGHQAVIKDVVARARTEGLMTVALTFDPHPLEFVSPDRAPHLLTTVEQRAALLEICGVDVVGVLPFLQIRDLAPREFAVEILSVRLRAQTVAVGRDFRFGRDRLGDVAYLREVGGEVGFDVVAIDLVGQHDGAVVSSTRIRDLIAEGDVALADELLGRPYSQIGMVVHGDGRGRAIGFPTANLHIPGRMAIPGNGVYAAWAVVSGRRHPAVVNIGVRPTFDLESQVVEAYLLDFDGDLYGEQVEVAFVEKLRDERRFESVEALTRQIASDVERARAILEVRP